MKDVITKAVEEERKNMEKVHAEEREMWKAEHARDQERVAEAIQAAVQEQRVMSQVSHPEVWLLGPHPSKEKVPCYCYLTFRRQVFYFYHNIFVLTWFFLNIQ